MKSLKKKRRIQIIVAAALALVLAVGLIGYGFRDGINLYRSPSQMAESPPEAGEVFRLGGLVEDGSLIRGASETVSFRVTDGGASIPVRFTGVLPDLFAEGQGMIGTGRMEGDTFVATEILAKHDENYMPREVIDSLKEQGVYEDPNS
ncbi:cytochrome c maturation protein CcmE [Paracoccus sp. PS-1]|uniref:cytochrome c maturation protein CcmE n=1 Tax=unclassified Paracoccus (in: a-proteobacteria) TaxID=2688777 RepID=UPI00048D4D37|nr:MULTISPECIES: cytochrome c maturation protein CcmE [unclassified Paracoccus (in: a-proteobacteria)]MDQ7261184.1 cytochrome c maturation protein CcmE [Paracoccus sp. PS1]RQP05035.1 MAG: cytochrome c maturation protein CcmE [Paracoccus sp. BP8]UFM64882.1 cytochrome c maturation protein CcmE [Paracoccus sp. MA]